MTKKIELRHQSDPSTVLSVVEQAAADLGFTAERHSPTSTTLHDGPKPVSGQTTATRARIAVTVEPDRVLLNSETTGAAFAGAAGVPFFTARINWRYSKLTRAIKKAVRQRLG